MDFYVNYARWTIEVPKKDVFICNVRKAQGQKSSCRIVTSKKYSKTFLGLQFP